MSATRPLLAIALLLACSEVSLGEDKTKPIDARTADFFLLDQPITIVFQQSRPNAIEGTQRWYWSINSAGEAELTISDFGKLKPTTKKVSFPAERMAAIRKALRAERFAEFEDQYGPNVLHAGTFSSLTVVCGPLVKTVKYRGLFHWALSPGSKEVASAAPALRVWAEVAEMVDPDGSIIKERKTLAEAVKPTKK